MRQTGIIFLMCCIFFCSSCVIEQKPIKVTREGDRIIVQEGAYRLLARQIARERTDTFLVAGGSGRGIFPFTAHFSVIPAFGIRRLMRECKSIFECRARGVFDHPDNVTSMFLYAANDEVAKQLRSVDAMAMSWMYPIVRLTFTPIETVSQTRRFMDRDIELESAEYSPKFLVTDAVLLNKTLQSFIQQ